MRFKDILSVSALVASVGCAHFQEYRGCKAANDGRGYECTFIDDSNRGHVVKRFTEIYGGNCIIDIEDGYDYDVYIDEGCDGMVDSIFFNSHQESRQEFGSRYDKFFSATQKDIGGRNQNAAIRMKGFWDK